MARRQRDSAYQVGADRWVVSYADFITLLLAFFVVMYSISSINEGKYRVLSESLAGIFTGTNKSFEVIEVGDMALKQPQRDIGLIDEPPSMQPAVLESAADLENAARLEQIHSDAKARFQELIADGQLSISANKLWLEIEIGTGVLFNSGNAEPSQAADAILESLAVLLKPYGNAVHVEGHTDDQPLQSGSYASNWELSAARAAGVVRILAHFGVDPQRMAAVGYGQFQPKVSNTSARGRSRNRRVVIIIARDDRVQQTLASQGSRYISDQQVDRILQHAPKPVVEENKMQRIETESGEVLFTRGEQ